jgi:hypothetical protein
MEDRVAGRTHLASEAHPCPAATEPASRRSVKRFCVVACAAGLALALAGCSFSWPLSSLMPDEPVTTGSIPVRPISPLSADLTQEDWRRAKGALAVALDPVGSGAAVNWDNPETGRKGSFTPVGQPFVKSDEICRAFLAGLKGPMGENQLQGTACRPSGGEWAIKESRPWQKQA